MDFLAAHRQRVYDVIKAGMPADTALSLYLPDDLAEQPVIIVGRPSAGFRGTDLGQEVRVPVHVLGRRFNDDGAQLEHDQLTDTILGILWDGEMPLIACLPTVQGIAGVPHPSYDITTLHGHTVCGCRS